MPHSEKVFNFPLRTNSFCVPFQVTIGGFKTFMGKGKNLMGAKGPHNGKKLLAGGGYLHPPQDPQLQLRSLHDCFPPL